MVVRHNCGVALAHTLHDAYALISNLQHRGREAAGIAAIGETIDVIKWKGAVRTFDLKDLHKIFDGSKYHSYLVHVRYATRGNKDRILEEAHPHVIGGKVKHMGNHIFISDCQAAIVHNGQVDIKGYEENNDSLSLLSYYMDHGEIKILEEIHGAYTAIIAQKGRDDVVVLRDPHAMKPGVLGWKNGKYIVASEDIALRKNGAVLIEDLTPGSVYYIDSHGSYRHKKVQKQQRQHCFFEYNYVANVQSIIDGISVQKVRRILGEQLAKEHRPDDIDIVSYLPRCPEDAARGYADARNLPFIPIFYKQRAERSFQGSTTKQRGSSIKSNLHILPLTGNSSLTTQLKGKVVYLIDDSTIRGNNGKYALELLKEAGVKKVYHVNYTPKIGIYGKDGKPRGCEYGVDMPLDDNFIVRVDGRNRTDAEINEAFGAEVYFLSVQGMLDGFKLAGIQPEKLCTFCIGGKRPFHQKK